MAWLGWVIGHPKVGAVHPLHAFPTNIVKVPFYAHVQNLGGTLNYTLCEHVR